MKDDLWTATLIVASILLVQLTMAMLRAGRDRKGVAASSSQPAAMPGHTRPVGITILAALYVISGAWCLLIPVLYRVAPNVLRGVLQVTLSAGPPPRAAGLLAGSLALARFPLVIFGALAAMSLIAGPSLVLTAGFLAALGYGMWRPKNWARIVTIILAAWLLAAGLFNRPRLDISTQTMTWVLWVGLCLGVLCYLFTPAVRAAFRPTSSATFTTGC